MKTTHKINLDFSHQGISPHIQAVQGDLYTRMVEISLYSNDIPWTVPEHTAVLIRYRKPDRTVGTYDTLPNGAPAYSIRGNAVTIAIAPDALMLPGDVSLIVSLVSGEQVLSAFEIILTVQPNHGTGSPSEGAGGCISGILPGPESAQVNQILAVEAVTPTGTVQKLKAIDLPDCNSIQSIAPDAAGSTDLETVYRVVMSDGAEHTFSVRNGIVGADGKSAYEYAVAGGYTGTEEEFSKKLAEEAPKAFYVNLILTDTNDSGVTVDKTYEEIDAAYADGKTIFLVFPYDMDDSAQKMFWPLTAHLPDFGFVFGIAGLFAGDSNAIAGYTYVLKNGSVGLDSVTLANMDDFPAALPNPYALIINGVNYSGAKTVNFTATINSMIDSKIPTVPTKTSELENDSGFLTSAPVTSVNGQTGAVSLDIPTIPTVLPNPHKLILTGAVSAEYDGAGEITVEIPAGSEAETETVLSDNLLDKSLMTYGKVIYYGSSGYQFVTEADSYYGFIPLRGTGTYRTKWNNSQHGSTGGRICLVNDDNTWICNVAGTLTATDNNYAYDLEFVVTQAMIDSGATKIAFDCHTTVLDTVMIVKDREYPSEYIPYGYIEVATDTGKKQNNILYGKTAVFLGDSICAGTTVDADSGYYNYGWGGIIGESNKMTWKNYGMNGGTITELSAVQSSRWLTTQADTAITEHPAADYVIFEGGCNDADQMKDALLGEISSDYATFDTTTFSGAFESLVLKLLTNYPTAKIGYIIPQKMYAQNDHTATGHVHRRFFDRAIEICEKWGIPYVDLWKGNPLNPKLSTAGTFYTDGQHLTLEGYQRITPQIEAWMRML